MNPLADASNRPLPERGSKRQRLEQLQGPATFEQIVSRAGIRGLTEADAAPHETAEVDDPRQARRQLAADLSTAAAREAFLASLADVLATDDLLHKCLLPINVTVQVNYATGDSLIRMLLNMPNIQQQLVTMLLHKLPEFSQTDCDDDGVGRNSSIPSLILGQLRWLEVVADTAGLTATLLEVLPVCSPAIQQQLIGFLPEVVLPQDHGAVLDQLQGLLEQDLSFMAAVLECISNMQLEEEAQDRALAMLLSQLAAVEVADLPGLVKYLLGSATKANAEQALIIRQTCVQVLTTVRSGLHFVSPADPRLPVLDYKQKGVMRPTRQSPGVLLVKELVAALQANEAAAAVCLKFETTLQAPSSHRCFDLLVLLGLHAKGGNSRRAVEACLKKKLTEGHATTAWITKSLQGLKANFQELWPSLLCLAETWARAKEGPLSSAAVQLYVDLFVGGDGTLERQQVLQALHGHLGSGVAGEQDVALQACHHLATAQRPLLGQYSSYLANVLDHLEGFTNSQLQQVFSMFAALTAVQPAAAGAASNTQGAAGATRLQDELAITLQKALAQSCPGYKRIGVLGTLAIMQQKATDYALLIAADGSAADALQEAWIRNAESLFAQCLSHPGALAFMMDQWAEMLERQGTVSAAAQPERLGQKAAAQHVTPEPLLDWLHDKVQDLLTNLFLADYISQSVSETSEDQEGQQNQDPPQPDIPLEDSNVKAQLWFNLDGRFSPFYMSILPVALSRDPARRAVLAWMPSALRLLAVVLLRKPAGGLGDIDALLGCPLAMPDASMFTDGRWDGIPLASKVGILTALLHGICWLREVIALFAPSVGAVVLAATAETNSQVLVDGVAETQNKLLMRLAQLHVLESLYQHLCVSCPAAALQLPDMSCPLLLSVGRCTAGPAVAWKRPPPAATSKAGKAANTEVQTITASEAAARLRCLRVSATQALNTCLPPDMQLASLLPATHIAVDLQTKLKLLVSRARRPAGLMAPAQSAALQGFRGLPGAAAWMPHHSGMPPCIQNLGLQQAVEQVVELLPALHTHLVLALNVIKAPPEAGREVLMKGLPGTESTVEAPLYTLEPVAKVVDALPAAHSLAMACLQTFTLLVGCHKELPQPLLQQVLAAAAGQQQQQPAGSEEALVLAAFKACRKLSCRSSGNSSLQLELAVLSLLQAITAHPVAVASQHHAAMGAKLSSSANAVLKESWQPLDEAEDSATKVFAWKGQSAAVTQLLAVLVSQAKDPSEQVLLLAEVISQVPDKVPLKQQTDPYGGYAALCSATLATWYKVVFEQLVSFWETLVADALRMLKTGPAAAGNNRANITQDQTQGSLDWDSAEVEELLHKAQRCCLGFATLVQLTKTRPSRTGMLASALKIGGSFVDALLKGMPFWRALYASGQEQQFKALIKEVQKGTKQLQTICNEGKARSAGALLARAPAAKKSLETFVFAMKAFLYEQGQQDLFFLGQLKHRDLEGNCVGSQLCEDQEEEEDENIDAEEYDAEQPEGEEAE